MKSIKFYLLMLCLGGGIITSYGQCCSAGNPLTGIADYSSMKKNVLKVSLAYKYSLSQDYYHHSERDEFLNEIGQIEKSYFNFTELGLLYSVTSKLSVSTDIGYFFDKSEVFRNENTKPLVGSGLGDLSIQARYTLLRSIFHRYEVNAAIGTKLPIGEFDQYYGNIKLPIQLQASSGSYKYFANIFAAKSFGKAFSVYTFGMYEYAQRIESEFFNYKYGNIAQVALGCNYKVHKTLTLGVNFLGEFKGKATRDEDQVIESSGGRFVSVTPGITYSGLKFMMLDLRSRIPVYKYYNGSSVANRFMVEFRISRRIKL